MNVLVLGAGGAASNGFVRALQLQGGYRTVGANCDPDALLFSECDVNHVIRPASDWAAWKSDVFGLLFKGDFDLVHAQADVEVAALAKARVLCHMMGTRTFLPHERTVAVCQDKWSSYELWRDAGVPVPLTKLVLSEYVFFNWSGPMWLRPRVGAGGQGSLSTADQGLAARFMRGNNRFGGYTVAEVLPGRSVTVQQLYWRGELVASQQRTRESWANAGSTATGVSGSTGVGVTSSDQRADEVADAAVAAVDAKPHGLFGVDMTYNAHHVPCVTEINIGRFFTTAPEFFARAGFNMAHEFCRLSPNHVTRAAFYPMRNPIPDGNRWVRTMDERPVLVAA